MRTSPFFLLLALTACRSDQVGPVEIQQVVDGAPVRVVKARGQLSMMVGLSTVPTEISSNSDKNSAAAIFEVRVESELPPGLEMASRATCRVGEWTITQPLTWNGGLTDTAVGATKEFYAQYKPSAAAPHTPSACEFSSFYGSIGMRPSTLRIEPKRIATVCWTPEEIVEGECAADLLPRARTEDGEAVAITAMRAMVAPAHREGGHGIAFEYIVTANDLPPTQARIIGQVRCEVDGETVERHANTLTLYDHLAPGESATGHGFAFSDPPLTAVPDRCTIELRRATAPSASGTLVAAWCIEGDRTEPGACD